MITREEARAMAWEVVRREAEGVPDVIIVDKYTREGDFGWVFIWDREKGQHTRNIRDRLIGAAPILVTRTGEMYWTGSAGSPEYYIEEFRQGKLSRIY